MRILLYVLAALSLLHSGAIFGFFYAWVCSTMWGLDTADPAVAITAMQAMNASVRNAVFAPAFFGTPVILALTAIVALKSRHRCGAAGFAAAAVIYLVGGILLTVAANLPLNAALAAVEIPENTTQAADIWIAYSTPWKLWNTLRTLASGAALALVGFGIFHLHPKTAH